MASNSFNDSPILNMAILRTAELGFRVMERVASVQAVGQTEAGQVPRLTKQDIDRLRGK